MIINPIYSPDAKRYENGMTYRRAGRSGVLLPAISLGLWHNFGDVDTLANSLATSTWPTTTAPRPALPKRPSDKS